MSTRPVMTLEFALEQPGLDVSRSNLDLSRMNAEPAGARGFVRPVDGHFVNDQGQRLRFFGVNLAGPACAPPTEFAGALARRLSSIGVNAVRMTGLDGPGALLDPHGELDAKALERFDALCAALKVQGIYLAFELHSRGAYAALDASAREQLPTGKLVDRFDAALLSEQREFARKLLLHENAVTHARYLDEPALLFVELASEDTIFPSAAASPDTLPASFRDELTRDYRHWLSEQTAAGARAPGPALEEAKQELPTLAAEEPARRDYLRFLRDLELESGRALRDYLKKELGLKSMLVNSQATSGGLLGMQREAELSDFIDVHGYWDAPRAIHDATDAFAIDDSSQIRSKDGGALGLLASYRVAGLPFVVSEYGQPAPSSHSAEMLPLASALAGFQDWDAIFIYAFAERPSDLSAPAISGPFALASDPAQLASLPAAALSFRRGLVQSGREPLALGVSREPMLLAYETESVPALWASQSVSLGGVAVRRLETRFLDGKGILSTSGSLRVAPPYGSSSGELFWEPLGPHAHFSVSAPELKLVCGSLSGTRLKLGELLFSFAAFDPGDACASVVALDDAPLTSSRKLLLSVVGRVRNAEPLRPPRFDSLGQGPVLAEYVPLTLTLPGHWQASALDPHGAAPRSITPTGDNPTEFALPEDTHALSFLLTSR